ncbi:methylated-DNA--[protein]-cysteine S-methyltransferase [Polaribacter sp.]|nr:methylated-DNA--[protein]-cysteine S-methyltransferase [Polaribacter sp.]MDB4204727.1 methylated-DNA--[protein]-cysteine S-methyltransferase [Polaribacter sp.]MDC1237550.1 methylated-DNA--[protein]-cysteine S-methyltransferase [Polaribacter sp.]|tara:strand:+ start:527 stop:1021 length:495 start_codon:yes stop_codon:yes gene_type:complete
MRTIETTYLKTPIGIAKISGDKNGIQSISVLDEDSVSDDILNISTPFCLQQCVVQLEEYFKGNRKHFNLTVNPKGTAFQIKVWKALLKIKYGKTKSYLEQSKALGDIKAIRAVATANGKNPLWIVIPCHRVIGSDGSLTGYAGGLWRKKWLLAHENPVKQQTLF